MGKYKFSIKLQGVLAKLPGSSSVLVFIAKSVPKSALADTKSGI